MSSMESIRRRVVGLLPVRIRRMLGIGGESHDVPAVQTTSLVNVAIFGMGAITGVIAARSLGPTDRGLLTIGTIAPMFIGVFGILGLDEATVYLIGQTEDRRERSKILWTGLLLSLTAGMVATGISLLVQINLYWGRVHGVNRTLFIVFALYPLVYCPAYIGLSVMRGYGRYKLWNVARSIPAIGYLVGLLALSLSPRGLTVDGAIAVQGNALLAMLAIALGWAIVSHGFGLSWTLARALAGLGWRNHLITVQNLTNQRLDQLLLSLMVVSSQVGMYSIAVTYAGAALSMGTGPSLQLYSHLSRDPTLSQEKFRALLRRILITMVAVCLASWITAPFILPWIFGAQYSDSIVPAIILIVGGPLLAVDALLAAIWKATGKPLAAAKCEGCGLIATVLLLYPAIRVWGINGAAAVSIVSYSIAVILLWHSKPVEAFIRGRGYAGVDSALASAEESDLAIEFDRDTMN